MSKNEDIIDAIRLYKEQTIWKNKTDKELAMYIIPSVALNQYHIFRYENTGVAYAFTNWAFLNDDVEKRFKQTGKIKSSEWNSGNNLWLIEIVSIKNTFKMMRWVYHYFRKQLKVNHSINWLRVDSDIYRVGQKFKRSYH